VRSRAAEPLQVTIEAHHLPGVGAHRFEEVKRLRRHLFG
jgi:hypothetical protein